MNDDIDLNVFSQDEDGQWWGVSYDRFVSVATCNISRIKGAWPATLEEQTKIAIIMLAEPLEPITGMGWRGPFNVTLCVNPTKEDS